MTDEQINIAIAEALGWTHCKALPIKPERWEVSDTPEVARIGCRPPHWGAGSCTFLNYCNDLNAMHEAEKVIYEFKREAYCDYLLGLTPHNFDQWFSCAHANARQRAEAFLRLLGKWEETT